jgi:hypothetical protein
MYIGVWAYEKIIYLYRSGDFRSSLIFFDTWFRKQGIGIKKAGKIT